MYKFFQRLSRITMIFVFVLLFLFMAIHLRFVQQFINNITSKYIYNSTGYYVSFQDVSLLLPFQIHVKNITISDQTTKLATLNDISFYLIPKKYSEKEIIMPGMKIKNLSLLAMPVNNADTRKDDSDALQSYEDTKQNRKLEQLYFQNISINKLILTKEFTKLPEDVMLGMKNDLLLNLKDNQITLTNNTNSYSKISILDKINMKTKIDYSQNNQLLSIGGFNLEHSEYNISGNLNLDIKQRAVDGNIEYNGSIIHSLFAKQFPIDQSQENSSITISGSLDNMLIKTHSNIHIDTATNTIFKFPDMKLSSVTSISKDQIHNNIAIMQDKVRINFDVILKDSLLLINHFKSDGIKITPTTQIIISDNKMQKAIINLAIPQLKNIHQYFPSLNLNGSFAMKVSAQDAISNIDTKITLESPYKIESHLISQIIQENQDVKITISKLYNKTNHVKIHNTDAITILLLEDHKILTAKNIKLNNRDLHIESTISNNEDIAAIINIPQHTDLLAILPLPEGHELSGSLRGNINISGKIAKPQIIGDISIHKGEYQFIPHGIRLQNIATTIIANNNEINIPELLAQDYLGNKLYAKANVKIHNDLLYNAEIKFNKFYLFNNSALHGAITGGLQVNGNNESGKVIGELSLGPMNINIPHNLGSNIPKLNIVEEIDQDQKIIYEDTKYPILLDIKTKTTDKILLNGRGVNGLVQGALNITGKVTKPLIDGDLKLRHGTFTAFGKVLKLKQASMVFNGTVPPSPYLNIIGSTNIQNDYDVNVILSGSIADLNFAVESTPATNQEDALSLLLFGQKSDSISPMQALMLANHIRSLTSTQNGFDPFAIGRSVLGVDNITISGGGGDSKPSIGVGKHLTENIYLEIEQGGENGGVKEKIELQITPSISIDATQEHQGGNSVGINWRKDY